MAAINTTPEYEAFVRWIAATFVGDRRINRRDFDTALDRTIDEEMKGERQTRRSLLAASLRAMSQIRGWYQTGDEYSLPDLPSFVMSHRIGCVWAVLLRQHHDRKVIADVHAAQEA